MHCELLEIVAEPNSVRIKFLSNLSSASHFDIHASNTSWRVNKIPGDIHDQENPQSIAISAADHEHTRTGTSPAALKAAFQDNLNYVVGRPLDISTADDRYQAIALSVRDRIMQRWVKQVERWNSPDVRQVSYLSAEFLVGPRLGKDLLNLGLTENAQQAMAELGLDLEEFVGLEKDPGLGNGGLGRLAACYLDSLAALGYPAIGYGIRYEFGIFNQGH